MRTLSLLRVAAAAAGVAGSITVAAAASASSGTIPINPGNVPATAAHYEQECGDNLGGGPYPGKDVWVFNLPGNADRSGSFTSITAAFDTNGDGKSDTTVLIDPGSADGDDIVTVGHSKAYAITTAGWTLIDATAVVTGQADKFVLTHTCAAAGSTTPPTTPTTSPATAPTTTPTTAPTGPTTAPTTSPTTAPTTAPTTLPATSPAGETPAPAPSGSVTAAGGAGAGGTSAGGGGLALTGANVGGAALLGVALIGGGAVLALRRRRRFVA